MNIKHKMKEVIKSYLRIRNEKIMIPVIQPTGLDDLFDGKVALITGGNSGIGLAIAENLVRCGCKVVIAGTNTAKLKNVQEQLGDCSRTIELDVAKVSQISDKIKEAAAFFGKIDILINSAGVVGSTSFRSVGEAEYDKIMDINTKGTFFVSQAVANYMIENHIRGHILIVSSSSALRPAWTPYQMSKWALRGFNEGLADELVKYGIVVNAIAPGQTATPMLGKKQSDSIFNTYCPAGRYTTPQEIANLAVFMVSGMGDMVIGDTFYITGGSGTISKHR